MKSQISVSIIIPNYNGALFLPDALNSVLAQTISDWECIIIDDGSTDDSIKVIKKYTARDKRFRLIKLPHGGVSIARNAGLDVARGEYIAFLDSDDCFTDYALEMLLHFARTTNADITGGSAAIVDSKFKFLAANNQVSDRNKFITSTNPNSFLLLPQSSNWVWIWRRIYRRELLEHIRFQPEFTGMGDDLCFMLDVCWHTTQITETSNVVVYHRLQPQSLTRRPFGPHAFEFFPLYFKYLRENLITRYDTRFVRRFYNHTIPYLLQTTVITPTKLGRYKEETKRIIQESAKYIPLRYLRWKYRILFWFLRWIK
jgi:glycosyltransferase involved in cell wall biosynthesis